MPTPAPAKALNDGCAKRTVEKADIKNARTAFVNIRILN
jgi:hypothetical protein